MNKHVLGKAADYLQPMQMKTIEVEGQRVLIIRNRDGDYYAIGAVCSHAGTPLDRGVLRDNAVMCPMHHSSFDIQCGARNQPPAIQDVPSYRVDVDDSNQVVLTMQPTTPRRVFNNRASHDLTIVIVGGGAAGHAAAEEMRRSGFRGRVVMLTQAENPPVDRTQLSKGYLDGTVSSERVLLRDRRWYLQHDIELITEATVIDVEPSESLVRFRDELDSETVLYYDRLILAMGSRAQTLPNTPPLENVFTLRSMADARRIVQSTQSGSRALVIGGSFTGMETAVALQERGVNVTVVEQSRVLFRQMFGEDIGEMLLDHHASANRLDIWRGQRVRRVMHRDNRMVAFELEDWRTLNADFAVVAVGVVPNTDFLQRGSILLADDGGVLVDKYLRTNAPHVYAVGDIATYEDRLGMRERVERWRTAQQQGVIAAHNIMGAEESLDHLVPFFWTEQGGGLTLGYVGHVTKWDRIVYRGNVADKKFLAMYVRDNRLRAAAGVGYERDLCAIEVIIRERLPITYTQMQDTRFDLVQFAQTMGRRVDMPRDR